MTSALSERGDQSLASLISGFYGGSSTGQSQAMGREVLTQLFINHSRTMRKEEEDASLPLLKIEGNPLPLRIQAIVVSYFQFDFELEYLKTIQNPTDPRDIEALQDRFVVEDLCRKTASAFNRNLQRVLVCRIQHTPFMSFTPQRSPFSMFVYPTKREEIHSDQKFALELWENQQELKLWDMPYMDLQLEQLLVCKKLKELGLFNCPNLFTLSHLSSLNTLEHLTLKLRQLRNEPRREYLTLKDIVDLTKQKTPSFDLAELNLPRLQTLSITWPDKLFVIDARKCQSLTRVIIDIEMQWYTQAPPLTTRVLDIRGLACDVTLYPSPETASTQREKEFVSSIKILRDEPAAQAGAGAAGASRIPAGLSLS